jgi:hypothetical protein
MPDGTRRTIPEEKVIYGAWEELPRTVVTLEFPSDTVDPPNATDSVSRRPMRVGV